MEAIIYLKAFVALLFTIGIVGLLVLLLKKLDSYKFKMMVGKDTRMRIIEILPIDQATKLILIEKDHTEYIMISSKNGNNLIEVKK